MKTGNSIKVSVSALALLLGACGSYSGGSDPVAGGNGGGNPGGGTAAKDEATHFAANVAPTMDFCRTCHVPGGVADTDAGRRFMLSSSKAQDRDLLKASWTALGKGVESNRILTKASNTDAEPHSGGAPWPKGSAPYNNMKILLGCWDNPGACAGLLGGASGNPVELPLIGDINATGGRNYAAQFCEGKADGTALPIDPRELIAGDNLDNPDYAVWYNDAFEICETPTLFETQAKQNAILVSQGKKPIYSAKPRPKTCGEWKAAVERGREYITHNALTGAALTPKSVVSLMDYLGVDVPEGLEAQRQWLRNGGQQQISKLILQRYGSPPSPHHNPAPLPGEDPNASNGGSIQLPIGLAQTKDDLGKWTGGIGVTCFGCHIGQIGSGEVIGNSAHRDGHPEIYGGTPEGLFYSSNGANTDTGLLYWELDQANGRLGPDSFNFVLSFPGYMTSRGRGTNAADQEIANVLLGRDIDTLDWRAPQLGGGPLNPTVNPLAKLIPSVPLAGGDQDMPTWWWTHNKTRYLWVGLGSAGSARGNFFPSSTNVYDGYWSKAREGDYQDLDTWLNSVEAPKFVGPAVNTALAEQGAILFHSKDLWAGEGNKDIPRPPVGNGSCASCHGAYSPRFAAQPGFLPDERLKGYSGLTVPMNILGTDPAQTNAVIGGAFGAAAQAASEQLRGVAANVWFSYPDARKGYRLPEEKPPFVEWFDDIRPGDSEEEGVCVLGTKGGYTAQPLHGVWASAPYFHNGSVPTVWDVLKPSDRPKVWLRQQVPESEASILGDRGFDSNLSRAYDYDKLGWKYQELACQNLPFNRYLSCYGSSAPVPVVGDLLQALLYPGRVFEDYYAFPSKADAVNERAIYNTHAYSRGNQGHEFTKVLTDPERRALVEYLKTL